MIEYILQNWRYEILPDFPDCFPENFEEEILPKDAEFIKLQVYRVLTRGILNREAFFGSYEENPNRFKRKRKDQPGIYSTSCYENLDEAENLMEMTLRPKFPKATMAVGITEPSCGPCQRSHSPETTHVHWWIYKDAHPEVFFKEVQ